MLHYHFRDPLLYSHHQLALEDLLAHDRLRIPGCPAVPDYLVVLDYPAVLDHLVLHGPLEYLRDPVRQ